ncbi:phage structural protein [Ligilactobacillus ruminis]|jgi:hypothetical protein|uniref:phage structural protein n=1 Tax=Ligilactobacillus ruminis TaxID=1623 RepID=UPI00205C5598|nr:phage protein [Ligilactobacillus ruminis]MDB7636346.1 hypothetical protein [Ligilactobacillus ruminis]MDB7679442.1 hypothetical protein [Ligilactobacillus ruminis]DAM76335.1 MAG TPA: Protein of unknown function (DUF3277) [Caudoviricetes sp.]DAT45972.1 MAG TPA: Protein of unknown function (DUF3277) [Caudoviricetes sp.]
MTTTTVYNAADVHITVDGRTIQGFQDGDMFTASFKEDRVQTSVDAQGYASVALNANRLGQVTINLSGESPDHKFLNNLAKSNKIFPIVATSTNEKISGTQAIITKPANVSYGKTTPTRTYTIEVLDMSIDAL